MLVVLEVLTIKAHLHPLLFQDFPLLISLLLPRFPFYSCFFIFIFKRLILLNGTKLSISLIMFLSLSLLNAPCTIFFLTLFSLVDWAARIMLLKNDSIRVRVLFLHHHLLLQALPALVRPILMAHLLSWIKFLITIRPLLMHKRLLFLYVLSYKYIPLLLMRYPFLIFTIVEFEFQALVNNYLRSYLRLFPSIET